jgi:TolB-like protein
MLSPAKAVGPQTLAVLPFRALNPADANLVDAIWDDTRGAIGRNPNLRVLGREAVSKLAKQDLQPADYRKKVGADYLLDGSVEHVGDQVRMKLALVRTTDGAEVWSDQVGGKLDDVFAFQQRIAQEVEGRIRGRIAPGGGATSQNIATSGDVYALYAEAKAKIRKRDVDNIREAGTILRKALAIDPNYAPAWADLGIATFWGRKDKSAEDASAEAVPIVRRALELAPNLGHAYAALALVKLLSPDTENEIRRAVVLDPGDAEAWMWLGTVLSAQNRIKEALVAHSRAVEIEPLFLQATGNKLQDLVNLNDRPGIAAELERIKKTGDPVLLARSQRVIADAEGRTGDEVRILLQLRSEHRESAGNVDLLIGGPLLELGFINEAYQAFGGPADGAPNYRGIPDSASALKASYGRPLDLWQDGDAPALFGRLLPKHGRLQEYVGYYRAAFKTPEQFFDAYTHQQNKLTMIAPTVANVLRAGGERAEAEAILRHTESMLTDWLHNGPARPDLIWRLAYFRAAEGRDDESVALLGRAVAGGALPDRQFYAIDIADEPCFARLVNRPDFEAVRERILGRIEEERRKVPLALLAQAYPVPTKAAA